MMQPQKRVVEIHLTNWPLMPYLVVMTPSHLHKLASRCIVIHNLCPVSSLTTKIAEILPSKPPVSNCQHCAVQFGAQEPGSPEEIVSFCTKNYGVTFPVMQKVRPPLMVDMFQGPGQSDVCARKKDFSDHV